MKHIEDILEVKPTELEIREGRILISVPFYNDPFFNRSVILLTDLDKKGCAGLILNKETHYMVREVVPSINIEKKLFIGGPVFPDAVFAIHNHENIENASKLLPGIYAGFNDIFLALVEFNAIESLQYKFFVGYSGWSTGQLEDELKQNMWVIGNANKELVFETPAAHIWEEAVRNLGCDYEHWLQIPKDISSN